MPHPPTSTGLTITNPLVLYRGLVANRKIKADPAQHRLALHLQKLYFRLKDYNPEIEYRQRLDQISRTVGRRPVNSECIVEDGQQPLSTPGRGRGLLSSLWRSKDNAGSDNGPVVSLTRTIPVHESAMTIQSPQGMLLYGEVGRGKSMLLDLLADCLPSRKKRRWHFNAFMLDTFRRLEVLRKERLDLPPSLRGLEQEHSVLTLAREMISTSPILFLDEFQLPDRAASKLLSSFLTSFFHLGGVLIATSNRMPEELAKAAGVEFMPEPKSTLSSLGDMLGFRPRSSEADRTASTDFGAFLEVLKARCEIWEMEGERDWRREHMPASDNGVSNDGIDDLDSISETTPLSTATSTAASSTSDSLEPLEEKAPPHYHLLSATQSADEEATWNSSINNLLPSSMPPDWRSSVVQVYGRQVPVPAQADGITKWDFETLCGTTLGPADYITLASTYHTLILDNVPVLTSLLKNEARRFITLLDALYEARCRLLLRAEAPPDHLFFPETTAASPSNAANSDNTSDNVYQETFAEIYQDSTSPFRPNVSSYTTASSPPNRSVLADEDADFGPTYGNGRGHGASSGASALEDTQRRQFSGPDFTRTSLLTGEDERFAYKRARSRLWEMCGSRWWDARQGAVEEWWRPMGREMRHWEGRDGGSVDEEERLVHDVAAAEPAVQVSAPMAAVREQEKRSQEAIASPFRTRQDPPPKFSWVHAWGMMQWGKKAGEWGKGIEVKKQKQRDDGSG